MSLHRIIQALSSRMEWNLHTLIRQKYTVLQSQLNYRLSFCFSLNLALKLAHFLDDFGQVHLFLHWDKIICEMEIIFWDLNWNSQTIRSHQDARSLHHTHKHAELRWCWHFICLQDCVIGTGEFSLFTFVVPGLIQYLYLLHSKQRNWNVSNRRQHWQTNYLPCLVP